MYNEISYQKIRSYLLGQLSPEEVKEFEAKLAADAELAEEVETHRDLLPALDRLKERSLHANFQKWKLELEEEKKTPNETWFRWYYIVIAALFVLLGVLWVLLRNDPRLTKESEVSPLDTLQPTGLPSQPDSNIAALEGPTEAVPSPSPEAESEAITSSDNPTQIAAVKTLSYNLIARVDLPKVPIGSRGQESADTWKTRVVQVDSLARLQNFQEALKLLNSTNNIPEAHRYSRLAYLHSKLDNHILAISNYKEYMKWDGDREKTNWELALYYLAGYPDTKGEFWETVDLILKSPDHKHYADANKLVAELKSLGVAR